MALLKQFSRCCNVKILKNNPIRNYSFFGAIQSLADTQASFFKALSESAPVGHFQHFLVTVHDYSGLPWWATIIGTTVALRTVITVPLAIHQQYTVAKIENLNVEMAEIAEELKREMAVAIPMYKWDEKTAKYQYKRSVAIQEYLPDLNFYE